MEMVDDALVELWSVLDSSYVFVGASARSPGGVLYHEGMRSVDTSLFLCRKGADGMCEQIHLHLSGVCSAVSPNAIAAVSSILSAQKLFSTFSSKVPRFL